MSFVEEKVLPQVLRVHDTVYRKTNGWIGHRTLWIPSLLLHTVGAKTGKQRTTSLTYARDGDSYLVVASKGGAPEAPGWYHNLKAKPDVATNTRRRPDPETVEQRTTALVGANYRRCTETDFQDSHNSSISRRLPVLFGPGRPALFP